MGLIIPRNRVFLIITAVTATFVGVITLLNLESLFQKDQEIRQSSKASEMLRELEAKAMAYYKDAQQSQNSIRKEQHTEKIRDKNKFGVGDRGFWQGHDASKHHRFDASLAAGIVTFLKAENATTVLELGAGTGAYAKYMRAEGIQNSCYDGNPETQHLSEGRCSVVDLSKPIVFIQHDWTLSLEVGEHIPKEFEDIFVSNLVIGNKFGLIVSWAIEGQKGISHVNNRNNSYIRDKIEEKGYTSDIEAGQSLRDAANSYWFKGTIMVFRKLTG